MSNDGSIIIDLEVLSKLELTPNQYVMLYCLVYGDKPTFLELQELIQDEEIVKRDLYALYRKDFITNENTDSYILSFDNLICTDKVNSVFGTDITKKDYSGSFDEFIEIFYKSFPEKIRQGAYLVRSDKPYCSKKMIKFLKEYKYDFQTVLKATERYVNKNAREGYKYIKISHYFIYKDGVSVLASECEQYLEDLKNGNYIDNGRFDEEFGKTVI